MPVGNWEFEVLGSDGTIRSENNGAGITLRTAVGPGRRSDLVPAPIAVPTRRTRPGWRGAEAAPRSGGGGRARDAQLRTPLHAAAAKGHVAALRALIAAGAALQVADADQKTPLEWAIGRGHTLAAQVLQEAVDAAGPKKEEL